MKIENKGKKSWQTMSRNSYFCFTNASIITVHWGTIYLRHVAHMSMNRSIETGKLFRRGKRLLIPKK